MHESHTINPDDQTSENSQEFVELSSNSDRTEALKILTKVSDDFYRQIEHYNYVDEDIIKYLSGGKENMVTVGDFKNELAKLQESLQVNPDYTIVNFYKKGQEPKET